jgi:DnaK suppressor protein
MASKKPASKARKVSKSAPARAPAQKSAAHKAGASRAPASTSRPAAARAKPAAAKTPAKPVAKSVAPKAPAPKPAPVAAPKSAGAAKPATKSAAAGPTAPTTAASMPAAPAPRVPVKPGVIAVGVPTRALRPAAESEEVDGAEPGSLLAGPRNVKPYIAKRGEQYMSKQQLGHFQQILGNWKRDLMEEVDRTVTHMKDEAANFPDPNDRATQEEEFSLELRTRDRERKLIRKIEEALKRIEDGSYGYCLETGEEIGIKRLEARPVATLSIEAQERRERRERQYGDRDDRYR